MSLLAVGALGAVACSSADPSTPAAGEPASASSSDIIAPIPPTDGNPFVFIQSTSSGYVITKLNEDSGQTVSAINLDATGADMRQLSDALATPQTVAAAGTVQGDTFVATSVYQLLPDISLTSGDSLYIVRRNEDRIGYVAVRVNMNQQFAFERLDVSAASLPFVDQGWLASRALGGAAVMAGSFAHVDDTGVFHASTIYLRLPDNAACAAPTDTCGAGLLPTYDRDPSRCLVATGCVARAICPLYFPKCEAGYQLSLWTGSDGCASYACDPGFDPPPALTPSPAPAPLPRPIPTPQ